MFGSPIPILRSFDEARAKAFYLDFLGFELEFEHRFGADMPHYMSVCRGGCTLHISEHYGDATPGSAVRIQVDDVDAYMDALRAKAFANARPGAPEEMPWGSREIAINDPAGNRLIFHTSLEADEA